MAEQDDLRESHLTLYTQLSHSFKTVRRQHRCVVDSVREAQKDVDALSNLNDQYQACQGAQPSKVPIVGEFPDLIPRLLCKIQDEVEGHLVSPWKTVGELKACASAVSKQHQKCLKLYGVHSSSVDVERLAHGTAEWPSVVQLLDWLEQLEAHFHCQYLLRKCLLSAITLSRGETVDDLCQQWAPTADMDRLVHHALAHTQYLLDANL